MSKNIAKEHLEAVRDHLKTVGDHMIYIDYSVCLMTEEKYKELESFMKISDSYQEQVKIMDKTIYKQQETIAQLSESINKLLNTH